MNTGRDGLYTEESLAVDALQKEVDFYRQNQVIVEQEIKTVIGDNQKLSQQVGMLLKDRLESSRRFQDQEPGKEVEELRRQITLLSKERDSLHVLWQTSQKTIDALENELKTYHGYDSHGDQNHHAESRKELELKLESAINDYIDIENKNKKLTIRNNDLEKEIKIKDKEISSFKERDNHIIELNGHLEELKTSLAAEKKSNEDLKHQLNLSQKEIVNFVRKEAEAKSKVGEALQLFDLVLTQRDEAFKIINESTEEMAKMRQNLANIKTEVESQYKKELDEVKERYNEKVADMLTHIQNLDAELVEKGLLLNNLIRENKILRVSNENYMKQQNDTLSTVDPKLALAEQRLEAMFQELVSSERRNIQLLCEKQCITLDMTRMQDLHARETKRRDWEEGLMKNETEKLRVQVEHLQKSLAEAHEMIDKLQTITASRMEQNQKMVSSKEEELLELNKHLENQMELNKRWKTSYIEMTEKLKKRFGDLQTENLHLREKLQHFQLQKISSDDSKSSN